MANTKIIKKNENKVLKVVLLVIIVVLSFLGITTFGVLTKMGVLPNFLSIAILQPSRNIYDPDGPYFPDDPRCCVSYKPVVYLYPTTETNVNVKLEYKGEIFADYPKYDEGIKGWNVKAYPDGKIINSDGKEYSYIFWEGNPNKEINWNLSTGFVVKGEDTVEFLQNTLSKMGLTPKEYNEFIVYWFPKMKENKYNLIHFAGEEYTNLAKLSVTPTPDSELRVFMVYKALDEKIDIPAQVIKPFERKGFSLIEWGGSEINK